MNELFLHIGFAGTLLVPLASVVAFSIAALFKRPLAEGRISIIARTMSFVYLFFTALLLVCWLLHFQEAVKWDIGSFYKSGTDQIEITLFLDRVGVVFLAATTLVA